MNRKGKSEIGITLVALIVTIVVLIILTAVVITQIIGKDILNLAVRGTENYIKAETDDVKELDEADKMLQLSLANVKLSVEDITASKISVIATIKDGTLDIEKYKFEYKKKSDKEYIDAGMVEANLNEGAYTYEGLKRDTEYELKVTAIDVKGNTKTTVEELKTKLLTPEEDIGQYVEYNPTYGEYANATAANAGIANATFKTQTGADALRWKIWSIDGEKLYLISEKPTNAELKLSQLAGFNNCVYLLDNICSSCYGVSSNENVKARNLKQTDIDKVQHATYTLESMIKVNKDVVPRISTEYR